MHVWCLFTCAKYWTVTKWIWS